MAAERGTRPASAATALVGAALAAGAWALVGPSAAWSVAAGALVATLNLVALSWMVGRLMVPSGRSATRGVALVLVLVKTVLLFGGLFALMRGGFVEPIALVVGYGAMPVGIVVGALVAPPKDDDQR